MDAKEYDLLLGRLAIHYKVLDKDQVSSALKYRQIAGLKSTDFGEYLESESFIDPATRQKLEKARQNYLAKQGLTPPASAAAAAPGEPATPSAQAAPAALAEAALSAPPRPSDDPFAAGPDEAGHDPFAPGAPQPEPAAPEPAAPESAPAPVDLMGKPIEAAPRPRVEPPADDVLDDVLEPTEGVEPAADGPAEAEPAVEHASEPIEVASAGTSKIGYTETSSLDELLTAAARLQASDLHIHSKAPIKLRLHGRLEDVSPSLSPERTRELVMGILDDEQKALLEEHQQLDFAYSLEGVGRFRSNAYEQQNGLDAVFRVIPLAPPTLAELGLPEDLVKVVEYHQGIVLFTGPAGCGKSSTMAAMVRLINEERPDHIITVEDPIEYVHHSARCVVNQREVGPHTESFARALRAALREDPDIIAIGELRDLETISLALTAAETGHLVLGTLHTSSAMRTINRLVGVFPPDQQDQIRTMVSESLRAVVSQRLVPRADGDGRVAALEVLINNHGDRQPDPREQDLPDPIADADRRPARHDGARHLAGRPG